MSSAGPVSVLLGAPFVVARGAGRCGTECKCRLHDGVCGMLAKGSRLADLSRIGEPLNSLLYRGGEVGSGAVRGFGSAIWFGGSGPNPIGQKKTEIQTLISEIQT